MDKSLGPGAEQMASVLEHGEPKRKEERMAGLLEVGPVSHAKEWGPNATGPRKPLMVSGRGVMAQICC